MVSPQATSGHGRDLQQDFVARVAQLRQLRLARIFFQSHAPIKPSKPSFIQCF